MILHQNILCFVNFDDRNGAKSEFYYRFGGSGHIFNCFVLFAFTLQHTFHVGIYLRWYQINVVRTHAHTHKKKHVFLVQTKKYNYGKYLWPTMLSRVRQYAQLIPNAGKKNIYKKFEICNFLLKTKKRIYDKHQYQCCLKCIWRVSGA